jgi:hypothetical protein
MFSSSGSHFRSQRYEHPALAYHRQYLDHSNVNFQENSIGLIVKTNDSTKMCLLCLKIYKHIDVKIITLEIRRMITLLTRRSALAETRGNANELTESKCPCLIV